MDNESIKRNERPAYVQRWPLAANYGINLTNREWKKPGEMMNPEIPRLRLDALFSSEGYRDLPWFFPDSNLKGEVEEWHFSTVPEEIKRTTPPFKIPVFSLTISQWTNLLIAIGFVIERVEEPRPSDEVVRACPTIYDAQVAAFFLPIRVRKPASFTAPAVKST